MAPDGWTDLPEVLKIGPTFWQCQVSWGFGTQAKPLATNTIQIYQ